MAKRSGGELADMRAKYMLKAPAAGDSVAAAIKKLQYNQSVLADVSTKLVNEVVLHLRALLGAGLIAARGGA